MHWVGSLEIKTGNGFDAVIEQVDYHIGNGIVNDERKQEKIEKHVKKVQPEVFPELRLVNSPGFQLLQQKEK